MAVVLERIQEAVPSLMALLLGVPMAIVGVGLLLYLCGYLHVRRQWRIGDSRKVLHTTLFVTAAIVQATWGLAGVVVMGAGGSMVIVFAATRSRDHALLRGIARPADDEANRTRVWHSWLATCLAGGITSLCFGQLAIVGYLVAGLADAAGEIVGSRWGRHHYTIPWPRLGPAQRSLEGSAAVALVAAPAIVIGLGLATRDVTPITTNLMLAGIALLAAACAISEAISPPGWDNFFLQIVASAGIALVLHTT